MASGQRRRLASLLLHDKLVTRELLTETDKLVRVGNWASVANLYALGQPFFLDLQTRTSSFDIFAVVDGKNVAERAKVTLPAHSVYASFGRKYPYSGGSRSSDDT